MKRSVLIVGGSRGLGRELSSIFEKRGWTVQARSRSDGYDINHPEVRSKLCRESIDFDVVINNARSGFSQVLLLSDLFDYWKDSKHPGFVVNVGSIGASSYLLRDNKKDPYYFEKMALIKMSESISLSQNLVRSSVISPGYISTDRVLSQELGVPMLEVHDVAEIIFWISDQPKSLLVSEIKVLPWKSSNQS